VGGQKYSFGTNGGSVAFIDTATGIYNSRNDSYNYDNYTGNITAPSGTTAVRGAFSSWLRITTMYPQSIKDNIDAVIVMGGTNDSIDATNYNWIENDNTDAEWVNSSYYASYGGDYNIDTLKGGLVSTVMKLQAWMPNAVVIIATPLSGRGSTGLKNLASLETEEYSKSISIKEVSNILSCPIIDVNSNTGINGFNRDFNIGDGVHPNSNGEKNMVRAYVGGLKNIYPKL